MKRFLLITAGLFFLSLSANAFYDPNLGRWVNRDPLGDKGSMVFFTEEFQSWKNPLSMQQVLAISVDEMANVNANLFRFVANDPLAKIDPWGLDWLDCMAKCIEKNDPLSNCEKVGLGGLGGTFPSRWLPWTKLGTPLTTVPSAAGKLAGGGLEKCARGIGRGASPFFVGYGLGMAAIECACAVQCADDPKSFDW